MKAEQLTDAVCDHGEGPVWDEATGALRLVDMLRGDVLLIRGAEVEQRQHLDAVAAVWRPRTGGGAVVAIERGFALIDADGTVTRMPQVWTDSEIRMNEGGCDLQGRFFCGSMAYDETRGAGTVYRLDADDTVTPVLTGVTISNGLDFDDTGEIAYYVDTATHRIDIFDYDTAEGSFHNRRPFVDLAAENGGPDGICLDAAGGVWVAFYGGSSVHRYNPQGVLDEVISLPTPAVTACTFGGEGLDRLFITTSAQGADGADGAAGAVFTCQPGAVGRPARSFAG